MKSTHSVDQTKEHLARLQQGISPDEAKGSKLDKIARRMVLALFKKMKAGKLTVEDEYGTYHFGDSNTQGDAVAVIKAHHASAYTKVMLAGVNGSAEAYMKRLWTSPDLTNVIRVMVLNQAMLREMETKWSIFYRLFASLLEKFKANSLEGSKKNIAAHYDLSNDFFSLFLDKSMMYSSAIYPESEASLEEASQHKLKRTCETLLLNPNDHLIEIGTGWGGMAIYAAKNYGCKVTTTTISEQQYLYAKQRIAEEGLEDKITLLKEDYRKLEGKYTKLVSIEMIEAVGHEYLSSYFAKCNQLVEEDGLMLIQAITTTDQRFEREKNTIDFIKRYIFPGGNLPSNAAIAKNIELNTNMHLVNLLDITVDYAKTLNEWRHRFMQNLSEVYAQGFDDRFVKMWEFYLCYCEGGFKERVINTSQFVFAKPMARTLPRG